MTTGAEEETKPPEIAEMLRWNGSVGRALEYQMHAKVGIQFPLQSNFSDFD